MECPSCGYSGPDEARFCAGCGLHFSVSCPQCQTELLANARFCHNCGAAQDSQQQAEAKSAAGPAIEQNSGPERRQLTILFCDLVGSTALSEQCDPEELRDLIKAYQDACVEVIEHYTGYVSRYMGDGILVLFGYPHAHEDDAVRAIHTGLGIVRAINQLDSDYAKDKPYQLAVRIGISTGLVVAGDLIGKGSAEEKAIFGDAPNIAARLQTLADPGVVLASESTRKLAGDIFQYRDLGPLKLKGISDPVPVHRVLSASASQDRFETQAIQRLKPLIGREAEIELLKKCWEKSKAGVNQVVLLTAEAGVGKSRLVQEFKVQLDHEQCRRLFLFCSPYHSNSAFYPLIDNLQRAIPREQTDTGAQQLTKLENLITSPGLDLAEVLPILASLLSIPGSSRHPEDSLPPVELKRKTLDALVSVVAAMCGDEPVFVILEDAHWIDPSTLEFINLLIERTDNRKFMMILTYRLEFDAPWSQLPNAMMLRLNRMNRQQSIDLVLEQTGSKQLPKIVLERILTKTDGVPLFVEEFTRSLLESDQLVDAGGHYELKGVLSPLAVPASLQDALVARLDRLAPAKELAQLASVIGRTFSHELIHQVCDGKQIDLESALAGLMQAEVLFRRGIEPEIYYEFKHALLQDAAYQSLLKTERQRYHKQIAGVILDRFPEIVAREPEVVAHHLTVGGEHEMALEYWLRAGQWATGRSANIEAIAHLNHGIESIAKLPLSEDRDRKELEFYLALGPALMATRGFAVSEVEQAYVRGLELCSHVGTEQQLFTVTWGNWLYRQQRGQMDLATGLAGDLLRISADSKDHGIRLQAHHSTWTTAYRLAEFTKCCDHAENGIDLYQQELHQDMAYVYGGHDAGVCGLHHAATSRWILGYPERAIAHQHNLLDLVERIDLPFSSALGLNFAAFICQLLRDANGVEQLVEKVIRVCDEYGVAPQYRNSGQVLLGWGRYTRGKIEQGLQLMRDGLDASRKSPARAHEAFLISLLAESCIQQRLLDEASTLLQEGLDLVERTGERTWEAELHRLEAEWVLSSDNKNLERIVEAFRRAIATATRQQAKSIELRTATGLAHYWKSQGQYEKARDLLVPVYRGFSEGLETADLQQTAALIAQLG